MTADPHAQQPAPLYHGGNLDDLQRRFPEVSDWMDLSTGISPWAYPVGDFSTRAWQALPSAAGLAALLAAARGNYGAAPTAPCVATPGSQSAIQWLPRLAREVRDQPLQVAVLGFTYKEHANCWRLAGHDVSELESGPQDLLAAAAKFQVVVLANPNNPDGATQTPEKLREAADILARKGGWLVVDEAFADLTPALSLVGDCPRPGLVVLRSLGKFFGLAGLRVGFLFGPGNLVERLARAQGPWALSGPALELATAALEDQAWCDAQRQDMARMAAYLTTSLRQAGLAVIGGTDLFVLSEHPQATQLFEQLCRQGFLLRPFPERPRWLRFGLPGSNRELALLQGALARCAALHHERVES